MLLTKVAKMDMLITHPGMFRLPRVKAPELLFFLKKEALQKVPAIASEQFSQEGELGSNVLFDLALERLSEEEESFSLAALNLPPQIMARFVKAQAGGGEVIVGGGDDAAVFDEDGTHMSNLERK